MSRFKLPSETSFTKEQLEMHREFLQESLNEYRERANLSKLQKESELLEEKDRLKKVMEEDKKYKEYSKQSQQRQMDIMYQVNKKMIENRKKEKEAVKINRKDCWGSNDFFEKLWMDKGVLTN